MDFIPKEHLSWMLKTKILDPWLKGFLPSGLIDWLVAQSESKTMWVVGWEREGEKHKSNFFYCTKNC